MITVQDAFGKFRSNLELHRQEEIDAATRQKEIRGIMKTVFDMKTDYLTGSYKR